MPPALGIAKRALRVIRAPFRLANRHQWLTSAFIIGGAIAYIVLSALFLRIPVAHGAYTIANSARFISGTPDYLSKTLTTPTDSKKWTFSVWFKRGQLDGAGNQHGILGGGDGSATCGSSNPRYDAIGFNADQLQIFTCNGFETDLLSNALFRDPSSWNHLVVVYDSAQATASNRVKAYINGSQITSWSSATYPAQNTASSINSAYLHYIGTNTIATTRSFDGYLSDVYFVDGQALDPTSFGQTDPTTGSWIAKAYSGTYGTNGFHLAFANSAALGTDSSGNSNTWTVNNLAATDQVVDTPTNNYATWNTIDETGNGTISNGNLQALTASTQSTGIRSTFAVSSGNWFWEVTPNGSASNFIGIQGSRGGLV